MLSYYVLLFCAEFPFACSQAHSLVVSSLPGNPLLVWEGVGLPIAACASMLVREHKLHSAHTCEYESSIVDCTVLCTYVHSY